jgi:phosphatidylethanolamine/phosphatidyl-N-methylethanolamine N-methyltransferase
MKTDPDYDTYLTQWAALYEGKNYDEGLAGYFLSKSHDWCERAFGPERHFPRVLEVGAGTGVHLRYIRHGFDEYVMTDLNAPFLDSAASKVGSSGKVTTQAEDATALSFADESFDRVIGAHVLEHLPNPHQVLREWMRVLKPGGTLSLVLPCDPGMAWRLGRAVGARGKFVKAGIEYDYWMAREHINAINNLVSFVRYYFKSRVEELWRPMMVPSMDLNLFYIAHVVK